MECAHADYRDRNEKGDATSFFAEKKAISTIKL
jgi:hypothetical protein